MEKVTIDDVEPSAFGSDIDRRGLSDPLGTTDFAINRYRLDPGERFSGSLHAHMDQEEVFVVVEGEATFETLDGEETISDGEAIRFTPGEFQSGKNDADEPLALAEAGCMVYAFPPGRLERVDDTDPEALLGEDMSALRERLEEVGEVTVERDGRDAVLLLEKLGREHRITADGEVSGPLADRLGEIAAEYLGGERS
jgi:mannose-6-phosphate isomerase-like protein (cupin superfamily)